MKIDGKRILVNGLVILASIFLVMGCMSGAYTYEAERQGRIRERCC